MADGLPYIESEKFIEADASINSPKKLITVKSVNKTYRALSNQNYELH